MLTGGGGEVRGVTDLEVRGGGGGERVRGVTDLNTGDRGGVCISVYGGVCPHTKPVLVNSQQARYIGTMLS